MIENQLSPFHEGLINALVKQRDQAANAQAQAEATIAVLQQQNQQLQQQLVQLQQLAEPTVARNVVPMPTNG